MSQRNRLSYATVKRGLILAAFLIPISVVSFAEPVSKPIYEEQEAQTEQNEQRPEIAPAPLAVQGEAQEQPSPDEPGSNGTHYYEEADLHAQVRMAKATENLVKLTDRQFWATIVEITLLIGAVCAAVWAAVAASNAAKAGADTVGAMRRSERAYVTMSHTPPGLDLVTQLGQAIFKVKVKNHGRTPATITDALFHLDWFGEGNPAPERPQYRIDEPRPKVGFFLVAGTDFYLARRLPVPGKGESDGLWLYGYVDYTDEFGQDHRGGYARIYSDALAGRSDEVGNLIFVDKQGWNYDRPREPDEDNRETE